MALSLPLAATSSPAFEERVESYRNDLKIPGMSAIIVKDQKVVWARGFGLADLENRIAAKPDTLYHLASITKTIAATLILQLVEQGKVDLEEPMSRYSSDFKDDSVRIKHLLSHTSEGTPGERSQYSGERYEYLTAVIEKHAGKPFREVLVKKILDPLGMSASVPVHGTADLPKLARPYAFYGKGEIIASAYPPRDFIGASAGVLSTVEDMAKFDVAIDRHVLLRKETQDKAWTPFKSNTGQAVQFGLGWWVSDHRGLRLVWHSGNWGSGYSGIYLKVPRENLTIILLSNSEALQAHQDLGNGDVTNNVFACAFLRLYLGAAYDCAKDAESAMAKWFEYRSSNARTAIKLAPEVLEAYVGRYQFVEFARAIDVRRKGDQLFASTPRGSWSELFPESESKFFLKPRQLFLTFVKEGGRVTSLEAMENGETYHAKKIE